MTRNTRFTICFGVLGLVSNSAFAYELATHALITLRAYKNSYLTTSAATREDLGLERYLDVPAIRANPFGRFYMDLGTEVRLRKERPFEIQFMPDDRDLGFLRNDDSLRGDGWLMRGAIREDDVPWIPFLSNDDPVNDARPLHHFFDPVHNLAMTIGGQIGGTALGAKNPNWALGTQDAFATPLVEDSSRRNHYSVLDAREAMWRALTLKNKEGQPAETTGLAPLGQVRKAYWATTFRALGDVLHMVQDLAQPQHSRNEPHMGLGPGWIQQGFVGHGSAYEEYIEARAAGKDFFRVNIGNGTVGTEIGTPAALIFGDYVIPAFPRYSDYFSTSVGSDSGIGKGMADYSNRGFFTQVKNAGTTQFQKPSSSALTACTQVAKAWDGAPLPENIQVNLLCGSVPDDLANTSESNVMLTSRSLWDEFLVLRGNAPTYHLVRENYDDQARLLLPRAIGYSAGLINYFFRGAMRIALPDEGAYAVVDGSTGQGFKTVKLKLTNITPGESMSTGKLVAVVKFHRNNCYNQNLAGEYGAPGQSAAGCREGGIEDFVSKEEIVASRAQDLASLVTGAETTLSFDFSDNPIPLGSSDLFLQVVFRGKLGNEDDAIAVATRDISEPTHVAYHNASDYIQIENEVYTRPQVDSNTTLLDKVQPQTCVDRSGTTPRLAENCFQPFSLDVDLSLASPDSPTVRVTGLQSRRFLRFAFLTNLEVVGAAKAAGASKTTANVAVRPSKAASLSGFEKTLISEQSRCIPADPFEVPSLANQLWADNSYAVSGLTVFRGITGWVQTRCVISGDGNTAPGAPATTTMSSLSGAEITPVALTILPAFLP